MVSNAKIAGLISRVIMSQELTGDERSVIHTWAGESLENYLMMKKVRTMALAESGINEVLAADHRRNLFNISSLTGLGRLLTPEQRRWQKVIRVVLTIAIIILIALILFLNGSKSREHKSFQNRIAKTEGEFQESNLVGSA